MLRTLFVLAIIAFGLRHVVRGPFYGVLLYLWVAYFRPEMWLWSDWLHTINLSFYLGVFTLFWGVLSFQLRWDSRIALTLVLVLHSLISTLVSPYSQWSFPYWLDFAKSIAITWLVASLIDSVAKLRITLMVIAFSLGFECAKQGWVMLVLSPGLKNYNEVAFLGDNNGVAVGMPVLCAMFIALARTAITKKERWLHRFFAVGVLYRGIITYSRGGFVATAAMGLLYFIRSKRKLAAVVGMVVVAALIVPLMPSEFWGRMGSIKHVSQTPQERGNLTKLESGDLDSALSRMYFWGVAMDMANDHMFTGVGHNAFMKAYDRYDKSGGAYGKGRSVHSSWFGVIAELGYPGITLYLLVFMLAMFACHQARRLPPEAPDAAHLREYAIAIETALIVIAVGGSFVIFQYNEMLWHLVGLSIALHRLAHEARAHVPARMPVTSWPTLAPAPAPARTPAPAGGSVFFTPR
jgi:probable O-glycosylation ligase (exosortase A-associated)